MNTFKRERTETVLGLEYKLPKKLPPNARGKKDKKIIHEKTLGHTREKKKVEARNQILISLLSG